MTTKLTLEIEDLEERIAPAIITPGGQIVENIPPAAETIIIENAVVIADENPDLPCPPACGGD